MTKKLLIGVLILIMVSSLGMSTFNATDNDDLNHKKLVSQLEKTTYNGDDLGASYSKDNTVFKVWAPTASEVELNLYATGSDKEDNAKDISTTKMKKETKTGVWTVKVDGDLHGTYYTYTVTVDNNTEETADIYAKACGVNGQRSMVVDLERTNPQGFENDNRVLFDSQTEAVVWEIHVKDFSNSESSGVNEENRGKYLAFTESDTTLNKEGDLPTCINYLKGLGVNTVQINPFYDFGSIDETVTDDEEAFNWGYDPVNYNVPEGSYSTDPYNGEVRINEAKQMIQALHEAGIAVVMDVVYNHTYNVKDSFFHKTVPNYYYRYNSDGSLSDGSACGNDTASEHKMYRKYMVDSVYYWATEYNLDGFRFDLMGLHDVETMNEIRAKLDTIEEDGEKIIMYGEAWDVAQNTEVPMSTQTNMHMLNERIGAFNDSIRDAIKGDNFIAYDAGFIQGSGAPVLVEQGIEAQTTSWSKQPTQTVTYASAHDNFTLYDKLILTSGKEDYKFTTRYEDLVAMNKLSAGIVLTSQGISFMLAGEEMARTKEGDENSYKSKATLNEIDWTKLTQYPDLIGYYAGLIQIRSNFAPFTTGDKEAIENMYFYENDDEKALSYTINNTVTQDSQWESVTVILNSNVDKEITVELEGEAKEKEWVIIADDKSAGVKALGEVTDGKVKVKESSLVILAEKESFEKLSITEDTSFIDKMSSIKVDGEIEKTAEISNEDIIPTNAQEEGINFKNIEEYAIPLAIGASIISVGIATLLIIKSKTKKKKS